jgi:general secretion pathway protein G
MLLTTLRTARTNAAGRGTRRAAFTLLEVLIVVAILVILASAASIALFRYLEDAKVGRAKNDMRVIEQAVKTYYLQNGEWPQQLTLIAPHLEAGQQSLLDPWHNPYTYDLVTYQDETDGSQKQRPIIYCQPPDPAKPRIQWPEK